MSIVTRFPPSPTGYCHVGTARMAIINYLFTRKHGGTIIFRSEDTDKERSTREFEDDIVEQLKWLGLSWDEFYRDTELLDRHKAALAKLIDEDKAYLSEEESKKEAGKMVQVVRFRNPGRSVTFTDVIRGDITFDTAELGDFVIARSIDEPLYNFTVVVNDGTMNITHVIRGEDHISNTPRQILIQEALGYPRPVYAHYPLLLGGDRSKLSKRTGDVAVRSYREKGYLPQALLNYIALLGWTPPSEREIMSLEEMIAEFELGDLHKSGAVFDLEKLRWYNRHYLSLLSDDGFLKYLDIGSALDTLPPNPGPLTAVLRERVHAREDLDQLLQSELSFLKGMPQLDATKLPGKGSDAATATKHLEEVRNFIAPLTSYQMADPEAIKSSVWDYATREGRGAVLWPLRYALSGQERSPDPFLITSILGQEETLKRIDAGLAALK